MKKYLIAGVVAIVVASSAAFAASLTVNGGVLQAGSDTDLTCTDDVDVIYDTSNNTVGHWIKAVQLNFDAACEDSHAQIALVGPAANDQKVYAISGPIGADGSVVIPLFDGVTNVADITSIQVLVKDKLFATECPTAAANNITFFYQAGVPFATIDADPNKWFAVQPDPC